MIQVSQLYKKYEVREVLKGIDISIQGGEIFGLLGPSGAGKTTLIKILTGQLQYDSGNVRIMDKNVTELTGRDQKQIGIMMDQFGVYERLSCYENLKIFADIYGISKNQVRKTLCDVGLESVIKLPASNLSKGMKSRLQLARVFMQNPKIIFLDEPTSGLDPATTKEIHKLIFEKKAEGCTIFLTTHDMTEATKLCGHVALLNEGRIVEYGKPQEICRRYNHQKRLRIHLYNGFDEELPNNAESAKRLYDLMLEGAVQAIHSTEPTLETVFLELTGRMIKE
ncbi:MAG: ABC transporter ATP-binding protein [Eubacteriales bacterium]|nr:ABC transporter ATP-binding protein [Eubacteriales bacterium]